ncbi:MAG: fused MFS/spermidine synthase, partial [Geodermatophilaceae bacterium]|nr:fused MFS/spermidine synthase [Geodermatophilaceae bacterium]
SVPWHLTTVEAVRDVERVLRPDGVYALNVIDHAPGDFVRAELVTVSAVFDQVAMIASPGALDQSTGGNYVLVASDSPLPVQDIAARVDERLDGRGIVLQTVSGDALDAFAEGGELLTDAFAPVDQLLTPYGS